MSCILDITLSLSYLDSLLISSFLSHCFPPVFISTPSCLSFSVYFDSSLVSFHLFSLLTSPFPFPFYFLFIYRPLLLLTSHTTQPGHAFRQHTPRRKSGSISPKLLATRIKANKSPLLNSHHLPPPSLSLLNHPTISTTTTPPSAIPPPRPPQQLITPQNSQSPLPKPLHRLRKPLIHHHRPARTAVCHNLVGRRRAPDMSVERAQQGEEVLSGDGGQPG